MSEGDAIRVAVRVRPFNAREKKRNAGLGITMDPATGLVHAKGTVPGGDSFNKKYYFDHALWSHDGFGTDEYVSQENLFDILGKDLLLSAWEGYNVCLFAYGQSGSGKSFSMTGDRSKDDLKGIVPRICDGLLKRIAAEPASETKSIKLEVSMLEIYIDDLIDLLVSRKHQPKGGIKTYYRQVKKGVRVTEVIPLTRVQVKSVKQMEKYLAIGQSNQTIGETGLNAKSSRAHTIFELRITKTNIDKKAGKKDTTYNTVRLVDLAGSERLVKTRESKKFTKQREIEGKAINNSLTHLGKVVRTIAKISSSKMSQKAKDKAMQGISWRTSKLTQLLRDSLGGNCKTVMIAAVSPSLTELAETCSTLRYANDIKKISCKAVKAVTRTEQLEKELKTAQDEIAKLKAALANAGGGIVDKDGDGMDDSEQVMNLKAQLEEMKAQMSMKDNDPTKELQEQVAEKEKAENMRRETPHLEFLHPDPNFSRSTCSFIDKPTVQAGKDPDAGIKLTGLGVRHNHAVFEIKEGIVSVKALSDKNVTIVNGSKLKAGEVMNLKPFDRVVMGKKNLFLFRQPLIESKTMSQEQIGMQIDTYDFNFAEDEMFKDQLDAQMKAKKAQEEKERAEFERNRKIREEQMKLERERIDEEKKKMLLEVERMKLLAGQDREAAERRMREMEERQRQMAEDMRRKEDEAKKQELEEKRRQTNRLAQAEYVRMALTRLVPSVTEANDIVHELRVPISFEMTAISFPNAHGDLVSRVFVKVVNRMLGKSHKYLWTEETFNEEMYEIRELFEKHQADPSNFKMPKINPFKEALFKPHYIGEARVWLLGLVYAFDIPDEADPPYYRIEGWDRGGMDNKIIGRLFLKIKPLVSEKVMQDMFDKGEGDDMPSLRNCDIGSLDVDVSMEKIDGIPVEHCSNVFCTFAIPLQIKVARVDSKTEDIDDDGVFETAVCNENIATPMNSVQLGYNETLRIKNVDSYFWNWIKKTPLTIKVYGGMYRNEAPDSPKDVKKAEKEEKNQKKESDHGGASPNIGDSKKDQAEYENQIRETMKKAKEDEKRIKAKEDEVSKLKHEIEKLNADKKKAAEEATISMKRMKVDEDLKKQIAELKEKNRKLEEEVNKKEKDLKERQEELEKARAAANGKSKGCVLL